MSEFKIESGALELGFDLLTEMKCIECGAAEKIMRPLESCMASLIDCPQCGAAARIYKTVHRIHDEMEYYDTHLSTLCVPDYQVLELEGESQIHVQITGNWDPADFGK